MSNPIIKYTDAALSEAFAATHADTVRYVHELSRHRWFIKTMDGWQQDLSLQVLYLVQTAVVNAAISSGDPALARQICSASTISAVERLARCHPRLAGTKAEVGIIPKKRG